MDQLYYQRNHLKLFRNKISILLRQAIQTKHRRLNKDLFIVKTV